MKETLTLNTQEQKRVMVLNRILEGHLSAAEAAPLLNMSMRQVQRILAAYRKEGAAAVVHGNRDRKPKHTVSEEVRRQVITLAQTTYQGCNQQHLRDLLEEREGITLSRASVHRILQRAGLLAPPKRRKPVHRRRRKRYAQEGLLVQIDGSRHCWLQERGPWLTLIAAIDDATGKMVAAVFREQEDGHGYFLLVRQLVQQQGRPVALYHDRHGIFTHSSAATEHDSVQEQLVGKQEPTQFGRLLQELAITSIAARSPQAKGRVERLFGTLQDRLVVELRLANAVSLEQANGVLADYVPRFNAQFAVPPEQEGTAYRPMLHDQKVEEVFCFKYERTVALDNTVQLGEHRLQLLPGKERRSYARAHVQIHERLDGSLAVYYASRCLLSTSAPLEAPVLRARDGRLRTQPSPSVVPTAQPSPAAAAQATVLAAETKQTRKPAHNHPWNKPTVLPKSISD